MPLWVVIGAEAVSGSTTIDCVCAKDEASASNKVFELDHFVSQIHLVDKSKTKLSKHSIGTCAHWLKDNGYPKLALELLLLNNRVPENYDFAQARYIVPYLVAAEKTDQAWAAIQQAKISGYSGSMYCAEAEQLHLLELEISVLVKDNRNQQAVYVSAAERLCRVFLNDLPDKDDYLEIRPYTVSDFTGLDEEKLKIAAGKIYDICKTKGALAAICSATSIIYSVVES